MRFLVVDDEPDTLLLLQTNVRAWGHECVAASTADEALAALGDAAARPDVLLLDVAMPGIDGPTLLRRARESGDEPPVVLLVSAVAPEDLAAIAGELGVQWLSKPFTAQAFRERMHEVTGGDVACEQ
jgi:two-component system cell cycle sensor histidine kinase/response regulator CckA